MSDFDKEAEREKLRKKYEREQADREATQRMSDLLLKGARMTNTHCNTCADPLFQQNGTTFCPSCHGSPEGVTGPDLEETQATEADAETAASESDAAQSPAQAAETATETAGDSATDAPASSPSPEETATDPTDTTANTDTPGAETETPSHADAATPATPPRSGDLEAGHQALTAALEKFARKAAETDDPRYAKECLEAARVASEALSARR